MIYLVEDDGNIRELVAYTLCSTGLETTGFSTPRDFWPAMREKTPDLILLDIMLPEEDGLSVLAKLKKQREYATIPVILLTAKDSEFDKVRGLEEGADDYIAKPFGMMELVARVKTCLRRVQKRPQDDMTAGEGLLFLSPSGHVAKVAGEKITLTRKEFELLSLLMENRGIVITRNQILDRVWGYNFDGESRTVDVHVRTLRQKLGAAGQLIETVRGVGYKMNG